MAKSIVRLTDGTNDFLPLNVLTYSLSSGETKNIELPVIGAALIAITRSNSSAASKSGLYLAQIHSGTSSLKAISASDSATVSLSQQTLTVTASENYTGVRILFLI